MQISELIQALEEIEFEHGNLFVEVGDESNGVLLDRAFAAVVTDGAVVTHVVRLEAVWNDD